MTNITNTDYAQRRDKILQTHLHEIKAGHDNKLAQAIDQLIDEYIIGKDVNLHPKLLNTNQWNTTVGQNQLRAEQRKIIKGDTE